MYQSVAFVLFNTKCCTKISGVRLQRSTVALRANPNPSLSPKRAASHGLVDKIQYVRPTKVTLYNICMYGHTFSKSMDQPCKVVNPARGQLNREN